MEKCSVREAGIKLQEWFRVGEREPATEGQGESDNAPAEISRGIYTDADGSLFEVIGTATRRAGGERLVLFRELFGDYKFWIDVVKNFCAAGESSSPVVFTLVKAL